LAAPLIFSILYDIRCLSYIINTEKQLKIFSNFSIKMVSAPTVQGGRLHRFSKRLVAFEHTSVAQDSPKNILLWVGGLSDGLLTVAYPTILAQELPSCWAVAQVLMLSSYDGWGTRSLQKDVKEISECVAYFRKANPSGKIVLMGHSTGCQDAMEYVVGPGHENRPSIDGAIIQAPVSDREARVDSMPKESRESFTKMAKEWVDSGRSNDVLPASIIGKDFIQTATTAYRFLSLLSPDMDGDDDYFSSDLPDAKLRRTFGAFKDTRLLILYSGADEHVPAFINKKALVEKWSKFVKEGGGIVDEENGGIVENAHHNLNEDNEEVVQDLVRRVSGFVGKIQDNAPPVIPRI
jgi:pimeloyl-ACP methyl ester carboxylesterase